jgi:hypothetical protein
MNGLSKANISDNSKNNNDRLSSRIVFGVVLPLFCAAFMGGCGTGTGTGAQTTSPSSATLPVWTSTFPAGGVSVSFTMVGTDPSVVSLK